MIDFATMTLMDSRSPTRNLPVSRLCPILLGTVRARAQWRPSDGPTVTQQCEALEGDDQPTDAPEWSLICPASQLDDIAGGGTT